MSSDGDCLLRHAMPTKVGIVHHKNPDESRAKFLVNKMADKKVAAGYVNGVQLLVFISESTAYCGRKNMQLYWQKIGRIRW